MVIKNKISKFLEKLPKKLRLKNLFEKNVDSRTALSYAFLGLVAFILGNLAGNYIISLKSKIDLSNLTLKKNESATEKSSSITENTQITVGGKTINIPPTSASDSDKGKFSMEIREVAVQTDKVDISSCENINPKVVKIKEGSTLTLVNKSPEDRRFTFYKEEIVVTSKSEKKIEAKAELGPGIYGVRCDSTGASAFLLIEAN